MIADRPNSESPRIGIIGAGPAGLTAAFQLGKAGVPAITWEADHEYVGGISRTVVYKGYRFDIGGHRFYSKSKEVEDLWREILPDDNDFLLRQRLSRIYFKGQFYSYPLDLAEVVHQLGKRQSALTLGSYLKARLFTFSTPRNLEDWVTLKFGRRLYRMFFKSYTEKVWGMPCSEISADWAAQRIKGLSLSRAALHALRPRREAPPGAAAGRQQEIKTLITAFRYPRLGPGMLWEAAAEKTVRHGGVIQMGARVVSLERRPGPGWRVGLEQQGRASQVDVEHLICSAPLGWLVRTIQPRLPADVLAAAGSLQYRDFITVALIVRPQVSFKDNWIYIHDPDLKVGRIQNFANWSPEMVPEPGTACYGMEYFTSQSEAFWHRSDGDLIALASRELEVLGLVRSGDVLDAAVVRQPRAYPVYDDAYRTRRELIRHALLVDCPNLHVVGRNGLHQYNNQDHSMMTAILAVRNILAGRTLYDLWQVNQDAEYLESDSPPASSQPG
ncbi:MAG: NAD(P)/FAD-dependent oxidoreductase [Synechococcaceae cyanobacterium]|nr:NAD(P)/FAD-dependent oxidoreductase [Synechococcaceae cyanobacterium]